MTIGINTKIFVLKNAENPADTTYVVERIRRTVDEEGVPRFIIEVRTERQRCFDRLETGYTAWRLQYIHDCLTAGTMAIPTAPQEKITL